MHDSMCILSDKIIADGAPHLSTSFPHPSRLASGMNYFIVSLARQEIA